MAIVYRVTRDSTGELGRWVSAAKIERDLKRRFPDKLLCTVLFCIPEDATAESVLAQAKALLDTGGVL